MTKASTATTTAAASNRMQDQAGDQKKAAQKRELLQAIGGRWGKFSEQELADLKTEDDLTLQVSAKYGIEKDVAQRDVTAVMNGRSF
jgi:hypothetical protein